MKTTCALVLLLVFASCSRTSSRRQAASVPREPASALPQDGSPQDGAARKEVPIADGSHTAESSAKVPESHRVRGHQCAGADEKGNAKAGVNGDCQKDSDCKGGPGERGDGLKNGRCMYSSGGHDPPRNRCNWDQCYVDSDCGSGAVCDCNGGGYRSSIRNVCLTGNCATDSDCGGNYCSPSKGDNPQGGCGGRSAGYFCHTKSDECVDRSECGSGSDCVFSRKNGHWVCMDIYSMCPVG